MKDKSIIHHKCTWCNVKICHFLALTYFHKKNVCIFSFRSTSSSQLFSLSLNEPLRADSVRKVPKNKIKKKKLYNEKKDPWQLKLGKLGIEFTEWMWFFFVRKIKHIVLYMFRRNSNDDWIRETIFWRKK